MIDKDQLNGTSAHVREGHLTYRGTKVGPNFSNSYYYINIIMFMNELFKSGISHVSIVNFHRSNREFEILSTERMCICNLKFPQEKFS